VHEPLDAHASWRYTLLTGLVPGLLILVLMPFVPESTVWQERKRAGTLRRPRFRELFAPELRRTTIVTTILSATAYAAAFGALQMTPTRIVPGLPSLQDERAIVDPLQEKAKELNKELIAARADVEKFAESNPQLRELLEHRATVRRDIRKAKEKVEQIELELKEAAAEDKAELQTRLTAAKAEMKATAGRMAPLNKELTEVTASYPEAKEAVERMEGKLRELGDNRAQQRDAADAIKHEGNFFQFWQEMGGWRAASCSRFSSC
jgi:chromosome segregation ATPase